MATFSIRLILLALWVTGCSNHETHLDYGFLRDSTEMRTRYFKPSFYDSQYHYSLKFSIQDHQLALPATQSLRRVPGPGPLSRQPGSMIITLLDSQGVEIQSYSMASPRFFRIERGRSRGWYRVRNASFDIPFPVDSVARRIRTITIEDGDISKEFDVRNYFESL